ncbi:MAG: polysaccharide deacetylase family protein [Burkholderiaceae bacterium]
MWALALSSSAAAGQAVDAGHEPSCRGTVYLTLDTGNMRDAKRIAAILARHRVKATFFLANERTPMGDYSLDDGWREFWRARVAEGHAFGTHTYDHVYFLRSRSDARLRARPQFGAHAGRTLEWSARDLCAELDRVGRRFRELTGAGLAPLWRAPGGRLDGAVRAAAQRCGYRHVGWSPAGFLGDELPSDRFPNERLLAQALARIRDGDVLLAHLGIWSRRDPFAPMLDHADRGPQVPRSVFRSGCRPGPTVESRSSWGRLICRRRPPSSIWPSRPSSSR